MITETVAADRIRSIDPFKGMSDRNFQILLKSASLRFVPPRTLLFREGDRPTILYSLIEGSVELFCEHDNRRCTTAIIRSVKACVFASVWWESNIVSARALGRSQLLLIPVKFIREMIETDIGFANAATRELAGGNGEAIEHLKNRSLRTARERLAYWMMRFDRDAGGGGRFTIPCDKLTLASYLGMARENLSRNLAALAPAGVAVRGRRVTLDNPPALAARAGLTAEQFTQDWPGGQVPRVN
jgi:CRP-like cAMP-binding protein